MAGALIVTHPPLILMKDFGGDWLKYVDHVHNVFLAELVHTQLLYKMRRVVSPKEPLHEGRGAGFWHAISEGYPEDERTPDIRRCERIQWIKYVIENANTHPEIGVWQNERKNKSNTLLWYREEYLVVLQDRRKYWLLTTAYCTTQSGRIYSLCKERDQWLKNNRG
jgi:hypothetical protein